MTIAPGQQSLTPELESYRVEFDKARGRIHDILDGLDDEQFNWRPAENAWSVAECLDHLVSLNSQMCRKLDEGIEKGRENGLTADGPFKYGFIGNWFINLASDSEAGRKRKFKAPAAYAPTSNHTISRLEKAILEVQDDLILRVEHANGLDLARIKVPSAAANWLKLSLGQWFKLLAGHQRRHFLQAEDVKAQIPRK